MLTTRGIQPIRHILLSLFPVLHSPVPFSPPLFSFPYFPFSFLLSLFSLLHSLPFLPCSPDGVHSPRQASPSRARRVRRRILPTDDNSSSRGGYTRQWFRNLQDGLPHERPGADQSTSGSENHTRAGSEEVENGQSGPSALTAQRSGSDESVHSAKSGYDFEPFAVRAGLATWSPRLNSPGSLNSSLPSDSEEEEYDWASSSEASLEERHSLRGSSVSCYHGNSSTPAPAVWCLDCQEDLLVTGCSNGVVEVWNVEYPSRFPPLPSPSPSLFISPLPPSPSLLLPLLPLPLLPPLPPSPSRAYLGGYRLS